MKISNNKIIIGAVALVLMSASFLSGFYVSKNASPLHGPLAYSKAALETASSTEERLDFNLYWEVWDKLRTEHIDKNKLSDSDLFYGSLKGLAESTGDPYTVFMTPEENKEFFEDMSGSFEGIGAEIGMKDGMITVVAPLAGMPAEKAGIKAGDKIYAIDGRPTLGLAVDEAVRQIRGEKGTAVKLTIIPVSGGSANDVSVTRDVIVIKSVKYELRKDGIGVISLYSFGDDTINLWNEAVRQILLDNPKGLILDLRNNPGGYLDVAVTLASDWIKEGPIVAEQFGQGQRHEYASSGSARLASFPTAVLINGGSASASEILAGALRDYKKGTVIGTKSFGKGSVQAIEPLSNGSAVKVTVASWLTPAGDYINDKGIEPEIKVEFSEKDLETQRDVQMEKAVEVLKGANK